MPTAAPPDAGQLFDLAADAPDFDAEFWELIEANVPDPVHNGPTWERYRGWDDLQEFDQIRLVNTNKVDPEGFILPELTLGWQAIHWAERNLLSDESDEDGNPLPFRFTNEQMRFVLWFYAIDQHGRFVFREIVLQRLKGWGKDPVAAAIAAIEFVGPCRFAGWAARDLHDRGIREGDPVAKSHPRAWVQIAAVSKEQTKNTMTLFAGLFSAACIAEHGIDLGKEVIYAYAGARRIESVTSSPRALEGNRPTLVIKNETHHWLANNEGHAMADAIERNATKAKGGAARTLSITNAYEPSEDSVAQQEREAWEAGESGLAAKTDTMYDSLEAAPDAALRPKFIESIPEELRLAVLKAYLGRILEGVRGDAVWLDIPSLVASILNPKNKASRSRRFWFNQVVTAEDAWADPAAIEAAIDPEVRALRMDIGNDSRSQLEVGWFPVSDQEPIVMFFDGSKSDDATAVVGCRLSDGYVFTIGVWQKPPGKRGEGWLAPRSVIDDRVREAFTRFKVIAFWGDPSHAKDDSGDESRYWDTLMDEWMRDFSSETYCEKINRTPLSKDHWPLKSGHKMHAVIWDMTSRERHGIFVAAAETFSDDLHTLNDIDEFAPSFRIDGHPALINHMRNARRHPTEHGISLMKEGRESAKKIDLAVCAVGARMLRRIVMNKGIEEEKPPAEIWGAW